MKKNKQIVLSHLLCGIQHHAFGLVEQRHLRVDHQLLEEPYVLRARVVVDAVDERQPKSRAQPAQQSVRPARSRYSTAAEGVKRRKRGVKW